MRGLSSGAIGFVGGEILEQPLQDPSITRIRRLIRRPLAIAGPKLNSLVLPDFLDFSCLDTTLDAEAFLWCLSVSQIAARQDEHARITLDYA